MLSLHKEKQTAQQEFLDWLTAYLRIQPQPDPKTGKVGIDALKKKSELLDYPGDYQKSEPPLSDGALEDILQDNKKRYMVAWTASTWAVVQERYHTSLAQILPIKEQLQQTDELIDEIVYRLYDLTPEEIKIVKGVD
jgi:hypothetical protein